MPVLNPNEIFGYNLLWDGHYENMCRTCAPATLNNNSYRNMCVFYNEMPTLSQGDQRMVGIRKGTYLIIKMASDMSQLNKVGDVKSIPY